MTYKPRNRNQRYGDAPLSWSQSYYDNRLAKPKPRPPVGFREREQ